MIIIAAIAILCIFIAARIIHGFGPQSHNPHDPEKSELLSEDDSEELFWELDDLEEADDENEEEDDDDDD